MRVTSQYCITGRCTKGDREKGGRKEGKKVGREERKKITEQEGAGKEGGGKGTAGERRQAGVNLPMASRSLHQVPVEGRGCSSPEAEGVPVGPATWSASASSHQLWQRNKIPGPLWP